MALEIERKFLVSGDFKPFVFDRIRIVQGYLSSVPERTVRVRIHNGEGLLTIKGKPDSGGLSRYEWETKIPTAVAEELILLCEPGVIEKIRHLVRAGTHLFEVDEFQGENNGLILAEIELTSPEEAFQKPSWLGPEVTGDPKYYNAMLAKHPFSSW